MRIRGLGSVPGVRFEISYGMIHNNNNKRSTGIIPFALLLPVAIVAIRKRKALPSSQPNTPNAYHGSGLYDDES